MRYFLATIILVMLSGCASLSEQDCLDASASSWDAIGWYDGHNGYDPDARLGRHYDACSKIGIVPDRNTYMIGWSRGIIEYCTPDRGYAVGLTGSWGNASLCPQETRALFQDNVQLGLRIYELKREMDWLYRQIEELENQLDDDYLDSRARKEIRRRIRHHDAEMSDLRWQLIDTQAIPIIRY